MGDRRSLPAPNGNRFQILRPHDCTESAPASSIIEAIHDAGISHQILSSRSDESEPYAVITQFFSDRLLRLFRVLSPQMTCIPDLGFSAVNPQIDRPLCFPFDNEGIITRPFELGSPEFTH